MDETVKRKRAEAWLILLGEWEKADLHYRDMFATRGEFAAETVEAAEQLAAIKQRMDAVVREGADDGRASKGPLQAAKVDLTKKPRWV